MQAHPSGRLRALVAWLRTQDAWLLIIAAGVVALALAFVKLGFEIVERDTTDFDNRILLALRTADGQPGGPRWLVQVMADLSALGSAAIVTGVVLIATLYLSLSRRPRHALLVVAAGVGATLVMASLKQLHARPRPSVVTPVDPTIGLSFPSGHTLASTAIYLTLGVLIAQATPGRRTKAFVIGVAALVALIVGVTRVYLGAHYPTDVLAGWMVGLAWALFCGGVARLLSLRRAALVPRAERPV